MCTEPMIKSVVRITPGSARGALIAREQPASRPTIFALSEHIASCLSSSPLSSPPCLSLKSFSSGLWPSSSEPPSCSWEVSAPQHESDKIRTRCDAMRGRTNARWTSRMQSTVISKERMHRADGPLFPTAAADPCESARPLCCPRRSRWTSSAEERPESVLMLACCSSLVVCFSHCFSHEDHQRDPS